MNLLLVVTINQYSMYLYIVVPIASRLEIRVRGMMEGLIGNVQSGFDLYKAPMEKMLASYDRMTTDSQHLWLALHWPHLAGKVPLPDQVLGGWREGACKQAWRLECSRQLWLVGRRHLEAGVPSLLGGQQKAQEESTTMEGQRAIHYPKGRHHIVYPSVSLIVLHLAKITLKYRQEFYRNAALYIWIHFVTFVQCLLSPISSALMTFFPHGNRFTSETVLFLIFVHSGSATPHNQLHYRKNSKKGHQICRPIHRIFSRRATWILILIFTYQSTYYTATL